MELMFAGSLPKEVAFPDDNEDLAVYSDDPNRVVICDGASESFDSKTWARVINDSFMASTQVDQQWVDSALANYHSRFDFESMGWSKQAAFERGSFATLLGIDFSGSDHRATLTAIGDSVAFLLSDGQMIKSFPYLHSEQFHDRPILLSTKRQANKFNSDSGLVGLLHAEWQTDPGPNTAILCMTDALGQWALKSQEEGIPRWSDLCKIRSIDELLSLVEREQKEGAMRIDDISLVHIGFQTKDL